MRVTRDERGAVAVVVAICGIMIFGFAAYAIDSGRLWSDRRHLITAADAAALGSAKDYATGASGCQTAGGCAGMPNELVMLRCGTSAGGTLPSPANGAA